MDEARSRIFTTSSTGGVLHRDEVVESLVGSGVLEVDSKATLERVPYRLTKKGMEVAKKVTGSLPDEDFRKRIFGQLLTAARDRVPWFHDTEHERMLEEGLIEPDPSSEKRYRALRLTERGAALARNEA